MPKILEIIKKYTDKTEQDSPEFIKELTLAVEELYNVGVQNGKSNARDLMINFLNT